MTQTLTLVNRIRERERREFEELAQDFLRDPEFRVVAPLFHIGGAQERIYLDDSSDLLVMLGCSHISGEVLTILLKVCKRKGLELELGPPLMDHLWNHTIYIKNAENDKRKN